MNYDTLIVSVLINVSLLLMAVYLTVKLIDKNTDTLKTHNDTMDDMLELINGLRFQMEANWSASLGALQAGSTGPRDPEQHLIAVRDSASGDNGATTAIPCTYDEETGCHAASRSHLKATVTSTFATWFGGLDGVTVPEEEQVEFYVPSQCICQSYHERTGLHIEDCPEKKGKKS